MTKVVKLISLSDSYLKEGKSAIKLLTKFELRLMSSMIKLAVAGPWKTWDEGLPDGEIWELTPEMFDETGDPRIQMLNDLHSKILQVKEELDVTVRNGQLLNRAE
jgi:hypothetical protein